MHYEKFIDESILFFDNASKRNLDRLHEEERPSTKLHLEKEIEEFSKFKKFWEQEKDRLEMLKKYSK